MIIVSYACISNISICTTAFACYSVSLIESVDHENMPMQYTEFFGGKKIKFH